MNMAALKRLLADQTGSAALVPGYNYLVVAVYTDTPIRAAEAVKANLPLIEREYLDRLDPTIRPAQFKLLPFGALIRKRSIVVPCPFDASINVLAEVVSLLLKENGVNVRYPQWS